MNTMNAVLPFTFVNCNANNGIVDTDLCMGESVHVCFIQCPVIGVVQLAFLRINRQSRCGRYNNVNIVC